MNNLVSACQLRHPTTEEDASECGRGKVTENEDATTAAADSDREA